VLRLRSDCNPLGMRTETSAFLIVNCTFVLLAFRAMRITGKGILKHIETPTRLSASFGKASSWALNFIDKQTLTALT
jgi:hypothetical protein